ncbi:hypothetical protein IE53DRAFT_53865 [Violaceomyces palustris]|uniref:Uncharacterized protein n=1 Tax=Violaceomyces palustris TaxID=1673888 RepID=A0ACD0P7G3_9BASI|nr:hypothetical protein IE53DRAFT_53865 [Violaceomyces palustris]
MSASLSPPASPSESNRLLLQTPEATTAAILGASSNGWSPLRLSKRSNADTSPEFSSQAQDDDQQHPSSVSPRKQSQNFSNLRKHGLVSNSIFKQATGSDTPSDTQSPRSSPARRGTTLSQTSSSQASPARSVGLGIGVSSSPSKIPVPSSNSSSAFIPRKASTERYGPAARSTTNAENEDPEDVFGSLKTISSPRKSKGFEVLQKANYVTNSPFRQAASPIKTSPSVSDPPLKPPQNAWAISAAAAPVSSRSSPKRISDETSRPRTPEKSSPFTSRHDSTPKASVSREGNIESPSGGKGLLVSNRLHGPRTMASPPQSSNHGDLQGSLSSRKERRKTVTFDEILDVQEFDKESSFDQESMKSESSSNFNSDSSPLIQDGNEQDAMWYRSVIEDELADRGDPLRNENARLKVVNASPMSASPALTSDSYDLAGSNLPEDMIGDLSSSDSRDASSVEEPASPPSHFLTPERRSGRKHLDLDDTSFDKSYATAMSGAEEVSFDLDRDRDNSFGGLSAAHRVDSMVDQLLKEDILSSPTVQAHAIRDECFSPQRDPNSQFGIDREDDNEAEESPARRRIGFGASRRPLPVVPDAELTETCPLEIATRANSIPTSSIPLSASASELPALPNWSPLVFEDKPAEDGIGGDSLKDLGADGTATRSTENDAGFLPPPSSDMGPSLRGSGDASGGRRAGSVRGRPHISRDAILERVAREKRLGKSNLAELDSAQIGGNPSGIPSSHTQSEIQPSSARPTRLSEQGTNGTPRKFSDSSNHPSSSANAFHHHPRPSAPTRSRHEMFAEGLSKHKGTEIQPAPQPSAVKQVKDLESPLEKLGAEIAAEQVRALDAESSRASPISDAHGQDDNSSSRLFPPPVPSKDDEASTPFPVNGRLSPSMLGAPPPPITPAQQADQIIARRRSKNGKGSGARRKRSMSTGDALPMEASRMRPCMARAGEEDLEGMDPEADEEESGMSTRQSITADLARSKALLDISLQKAIDTGFGTGIEREISRIYRQGDQKYKVNDRGTFTSSADKVSHSSQAGDVDSGKAWRKLRRPSDMNEYAKEMREFRENENPKKACGKVFVMVDSFIPANLPVPSRPTFFHCILDNGLHMVKTATVPLRSGGDPSKINQEFELIQHKNLEFSLTLVVRRDEHLVEPQPTPASPTLRKEKISPTLKGVSRFFASPKKAAAKREQQEKAQAAEVAFKAARMEPMLSYINREGAFGRAGVVFEKVVSQCTARCLVLEVPVVGVNDPQQSLGGPSSLASRNYVNASRNADFKRNIAKVRGTLRLKLFYLPPMPNIARNLLPENIGDCIRGMQNAAWHHSSPWLEGTLTQLGGDCRSWRRRPVKARGSNLICYNEITKKPTVKIDLSKAVSVEDNEDPVGTPSFTPSSSQANDTPASGATGRASSRATTAKSVYAADEEEDEIFHVEKSFRIIFGDGEKISFFSDTEAEKAEWIRVLRNIIEEDIPPNPIWAQMALEAAKGTVANPSATGAAAGPGSKAGPQVRKTSKQLREGRKAPPNIDEVEENAQGSGAATGGRTEGFSLAPPSGQTGDCNRQRNSPSPVPSPLRSSAPIQAPSIQAPVQAAVIGPIPSSQGFVPRRHQANSELSQKQRMIDAVNARSQAKDSPTPSSLPRPSVQGPPSSLRPGHSRSSTAHSSSLPRPAAEVAAPHHGGTTAARAFQTGGGRVGSSAAAGRAGPGGENPIV